MAFVDSEKNRLSIDDINAKFCVIRSKLNILKVNLSLLGWFVCRLITTSENDVKFEI